VHRERSEPDDFLGRVGHRVGGCHEHRWSSSNMGEPPAQL
jgi:hypothetical protein